MESNMQPPAELSEIILAKVRRDLDPPAIQVFIKLLGIHTVVSFLTLNLCPQFGFRLFGEGPGLMAYFMKFGDAGCMAACGVIFLGATTFISSILLSRDEARKLIRQWPVHGLVLAGFSLAFFLSVDAYITFSAVIWWTIGSLMGGYASLRGGLLLRRAFS